ncbi:MAG: hypothetical protein ACYSWU_00150 [Planctomycetota bacterium]
MTVAMEMGMDRVNAGMAVPQLWLMAATTDVYNPVTIMIVETLQHKLATLGYPNRQDGFVDKATAAAMRELSGPNWKSKTWLQLYGDVLYRGNHSASPTGAMGMGYSSMGLVLQPNWCSTKNPQGNCKPIRGIVLPMTIETANLFKAVQNQANRVASSYGWSRIAVDGRLGSGTLSLVNKCLAKIPAPTFSDVDGLALTADLAMEKLHSQANQLNVATKVPSPPPKAPPSGTGGVVNPPRDQIVAGLPLLQRVQQSNLALVGIGLAVVGGLYYYESKKKGKKLKPPKLLKGIF